ncbi:integrase core domain-containing protein [Leucobacter sp. W1478]|uniref:integrase core domain-containing protein n=1 Tax=Leucobacter sp. W1478 TaxID=3439065 RepID=UPI003F2E34B5
MKNNPIDPRVRLAIAQWPLGAPRGSVTTFCTEHGISRKSFYLLRARAQTEGQAAALEPRSRRPHHHPTRITDVVQRDALGVRAALESSGLDCGPISVHDRMKHLAMEAPSVASLARIFRDAGVARQEPKKKPRSAYRRFAYPAPNASWQLDATEYVLTGGRKCVIFQLEDDHSRLAVASYVTWEETSEGALAVVKQGISKHGVPQRLLTDNGSALNPSQLGKEGQLVKYVTSLGVAAITGKPYKPTTQGKNERFHQTLFRWLDRQPLAESLAQLQALVDRFDVIYNTERPHQWLPGRITPQQAWDATPVAEAPRPSREPGVEPRRSRADTYVQGEAVRRVGANAQVTVIGTSFTIGQAWFGEELVAIWDIETIAFFDQRGEFILSYLKPPRRTKSVTRKHALEIGTATSRVSPMS